LKQPSDIFHPPNLSLLTNLFHLDKMYRNSLLVVVTLFITVCGLVKLGYRFRFSCLQYIPEPITILLIGVIFGNIANYCNVELKYFNDRTFFVVFLPPIIFEAVLHLQKHYFLRNLLVILLFGFVGTLFVFLLISCGLWLIICLFPSVLGNWTPRPVAFFLFATLVSSVDSVIIIGILGEMRVHPSLYFIFVGESIINDGVTLVLFDFIYSISCTDEVKLNSFKLSIFGFIVLIVKFLGSCLLGAIVGSMTSFLTKYTYKYTMIEPLIVLSAGYLAYLIDFGISWPGVFSLLVFGLIQTTYTFENISVKSFITIKRLAHMTAAVSESLIFLSIGYTLVIHKQVWNAKFIAISLVLCTLSRFLVVYFLSSLANFFHWMGKPITKTMKFVIAFCGLRGALSHSLVEIIDPRCLQRVGVNPAMYQTTTVFITFFAIVIIGAFLRPLLHIFQMRIEKQPLSLFVTVNEEVMHKTISAIEDITGLSGSGILEASLRKFDER
uniref:Sodium/hydrogen exchanger n=1 Tax=Echinostoma caproni TaxID=27848 RepID=A0A183AXF5_9TREM